MNLNNSTDITLSGRIVGNGGRGVKKDLSSINGVLAFYGWEN